MNKKIKLKTAIIVWISVFILSIGTTFAIITWNSNNTKLAGNTMCFDILYTKGQDINFGTVNSNGVIENGMTASLDFNESTSASTTVTFQRKPNCALYGIGTITANISVSPNNVAMSKGGLNYVIKNNTTNETVKTGAITKTGATTIYDDFTINESITYTIYFWLDADYIDNTYLEANFSGTIESSAISTTDYGVTITQDPSNANIPNIKDGMIPVYYDNGDWKKADKSNKDYNWFNYSEKKWANVVLLNSDTARDTYNSASNGTIVDMDDIAAFYVWIPRYKYRTWNINRQSCGSTDISTCEAKYSYSAYSTGIDIIFESGTSSTGNVTCTYNPTNTIDPTILSDTCIVNNTTTITTSTDNTTFTGSNEAWYTHPAFTFGEGNEITGFWVGKFETTGTSTAPTIKPNINALVNQNVASQFTTSRLFETSTTYGITDSGLNAHMLKNLEWGAVAYLSYSDYGMCNGTSCTGIYINNAYNSTTYGNTGRSGGAIAGSPETVATHYPDSGSTSTNKYSDYGYYTYDGKEVAYDGTIGDYASDITLGTNASTTGNVYGVYDMNGGSYEYVMADMYSIPTGTYIGPIGTSNSSFNGVDYTGTTIYSSGNTLLATVTSSSIVANTDNLKYYDSYSYGASGTAQTAWNRSRLGDATGEIVSGTSFLSAWITGSGVNGSASGFIHSSYSWFLRGGSYRDSYSGTFDFDYNNGTVKTFYSFRSSLS